MIIGSIIFLLLIASLFLFGTVEIWSFAIVQIIAAILGFACIAKGFINKNYSFLHFKAIILLFIVLTVCIIQIVPLFNNTSKFLNPKKAEVIDDFNSTFNKVNGKLSMSNFWIKELIGESLNKFNQQYPRTISINPYKTKLGIYKLIAYLIIFISVLNWLTERKLASTVIILIVIVGFLGAFIGFINNFLNKEKLLFLREPVTHFFAPFYNANYFAFYELLVIPLALGLIFCLIRRGKYFRASRESRGPLLIIYSFMLILIMVSVFFSLSRSGIIFSVSLLIFLTIGTYKLDRGIYIVLIALMLFILLGIFLFRVGILPIKDELISLQQEPKAAGSLATRIDAWVNSIAVIKKNWMVGTGLGTFSFAFQKDQPLIAYRFNRLHNDYLECLIENGILPFILILILIAMYYKKLFNNWHALNSQTQRILILSVASSITIILMLSLIDFPLQLGAIAVLFTIIAALGLALGNNYEHTRSLSKYNFGSVAISLIICFILLIFSAKMLVFDLKRLSFSNLKDLSIAELNEQKTDFTKYSIDNAEGHYILGSKRLNACVKEVDFAIESLKKGNYVADTQWRLMMKENLKIVVQELLEGAILEPNNSKYWVRLGQTLELIEWVSDLSNPISVEMIESELKEPVRMGELSQAAEILYLRAIDIDPINIESYTALAKIYYKHGKLAEAIKMYQNSLYIGGQDYLLLHSFEDIYKQERQSKE